MLLPCKCGTEEPVHGTHEIHDDTLLEFRHEQFFLCGIGGIKDEIIYINANVHGRRRVGRR
eukprot:scaffold23741_cov22-Cyclotella_meneghiniana.AAC.1